MEEDGDYEPEPDDDVESRAGSPTPSQADSEYSIAPSFLTWQAKSRKRTRSSRASSVAESDVSASTTASGKRRAARNLKRQLDKNPSIYDLAAGKVRQPSRHTSFVGIPITKPYPPVEYYFDKKRVKTGDEDEDSRLYWRRDVEKHTLPSSELLWTVHRHATKFFEEKGENHMKFMDESALLAIGVLLEETMKQSLGKDGHRAFLEREESKVNGGEPVAEEDDEVDQDNEPDASEDTNTPSDDAAESKDDLYVGDNVDSRISEKARAKGYTADEYLTD